MAAAATSAAAAAVAAASEDGGLEPQAADDGGGGGVLRALEFFSGVGGFHYALARAAAALGQRYEVVGAYDLNNNANHVYQHNFRCEHRTDPSRSCLRSLCSCGAEPRTCAAGGGHEPTTWST
eukprot:scaffold55_cov401-Prasinococcus_capsulatus_cf.AAC.1